VESTENYQGYAGKLQHAVVLSSIENGFCFAPGSSPRAKSQLYTDRRLVEQALLFHEIKQALDDSAAETDIANLPGQSNAG
jgi:hypothetical protein